MISESWEENTFNTFKAVLSDCRSAVFTIGLFFDKTNAIEQKRFSFFFFFWIVVYIKDYISSIIYILKACFNLYITFKNMSLNATWHSWHLMWLDLKYHQHQFPKKQNNIYEHWVNSLETWHSSQPQPISIQKAFI